MAGPVRQNLMRLLALFVMANGGQAYASFLTAPSELEGTIAFSVEFTAGPALSLAGVSAGDWVLVPSAGAPESPLRGEIPDRVVEPAIQGLLASPGGISGTGQGSGSGSSFPGSSGLLTSEVHVPGGILRAYFVREGRCLLPVPFLSGIFRPPRTCSTSGCFLV